jgi:chorismate mutase/prephenate dehydrogenase
MPSQKELKIEMVRLGEKLVDLDADLLRLVARRQEISVRMGEIKQNMGERNRDFQQEKDVLERARELGCELLLPEALCDQLFSLLIKDSLATQERQAIAVQGEGDGRRVLVIGGAGKMGRWFARFLDSQGFEIEISDPIDGMDGYKNIGRWEETDLDHDVIVVAAQIRESTKILEGLLHCRPSGLVIDISSLKSPMRRPLQALVEEGIKVSSIHPMFGPDTELLSGRHVIFIDLGVEEAHQAARSLFASTTAELVDMDLEEHDRLIAYVLGLSHALNIAFVAALAKSGEDAPRLAQLSSTTFDAQLRVASQVAHDNPHLYFEIQSLNDYGSESLSALQKVVSQLKSIVESGDERGFVDLMRESLQYLKSRLREGAD